MQIFFTLDFFPYSKDHRAESEAAGWPLTNMISFQIYSLFCDFSPEIAMSLLGSQSADGFF